MDEFSKQLLYARVFEVTSDAVIITDRQQTILSVNPAFTKITGYSREEALGKTPALLKSGRHDSAFYDDMWKQLQKSGEWQGSIWNRRKNGELYPEWLTITSIEGQDGKPQYYSAIFCLVYLQIVWSSLVGYFFFNEYLNTYALIGAILIVFSGIISVPGQIKQVYGK